MRQAFNALVVPHSPRNTYNLALSNSLGGHWCIMVRKRKIIVEIAASADGFIGRSDVTVDWLERAKGDYEMGAFYASIDTIVWGRKTYDMALEFQRKGDAGSQFDTRVKNYVFTHNLPKGTAPA